METATDTDVDSIRLAGGTYLVGAAAMAYAGHVARARRLRRKRRHLQVLDGLFAGSAEPGQGDGAL